MYDRLMPVLPLITDFRGRKNARSKGSNPLGWTPRIFQLNNIKLFVVNEKAAGGGMRRSLTCRPDYDRRAINGQGNTPRMTHRARSEISAARLNSAPADPFTFVKAAVRNRAICMNV